MELVYSEIGTLFWRRVVRCQLTFHLDKSKIHVIIQKALNK